VEENLIHKKSNILDPIHDTLDQDVFNGMTPKSAFFEYHLDHVREVFRQNNFNPYAFDFYLTGSLCTYQYSEKSDVDISIVCNADEFDEEDRADLIAIVIESLDGTFFPRTKHQYQHFVQPIGVDIEDLFILGLRSAWDFQKNEWVLKPKRPTTDIKKEKPDWILMGVQVSDKINTLIDNHKYEDAKAMYKKVHQKRKEDQIDYGDYSEGNVIYKFLDNNGTFDRLKNVGQRIAFQKEAFTKDDFVNYYYESTFYNRSFRQKTHLNSKGYPCDCTFGKKDLKAVAQYYNNINKTDSEDFKFSFNKNSNEGEESKIKQIAQKILDKQISEESKWNKRYPVWKERLQSIVDMGVLTEESIKFWGGIISLYKKAVQRNDVMINNNAYRMYLFSGPTDPLYRDKDYLQSYKEDFRKLWTGNFGKNTKVGDFINSENYEFLGESYDWSAESEFIGTIDRLLYTDISLDEEIDFSWRWWFSLQNSDNNQLNNKLQKIENLFNQKIKEMKKDNHLDFGFLTTLNKVSMLLTDRYGNYVENFENILDMILDGSIFKMRPEEVLDFYVQNRSNYPARNTIFEGAVNAIQYMNSIRLQYLLNEYKDLRFPTNLEGMDSFNELSLSLRQIETETKEREEYKELLRQFKEGEVAYESDSPVFTFEVKKGNPEKAKPGVWGVYRLESTDDLELEGSICNHCIGSWEQPHIRRRDEDLNTVYSVRDPDGVPWTTLELDKEGVILGQAFGRQDHAVRQNEQKILNAFFGQESFQRQSKNPNKYIVRTRNGKEYVYNASSTEDAVEQHKEAIKSIPLPFDYPRWAYEEEIKGLKAVAAYGAGHDWFDKPEGQRSGLYYESDLPVAEEDIETTEYHMEPDVFWGLSNIPEISSGDELETLWQWVEGDYGESAYLFDMMNYYYPDEDTPVEELERDDYGYALVRIVEPYTFDGSYSNVFNFINSIVEKYENLLFDEENNISDEIWDFYESVKGLGTYIILTSISTGQIEKIINTYVNAFDFYVQKQTSMFYKENKKNKIAILNGIRIVLKDLISSVDYTTSVNDIYHLFDDSEISKSLESEYGSWNYNYDFENSYVEFQIEPKSMPKEEINQSRTYLINYVQYAINLSEEIKELTRNFFERNLNSPIQRTIWFNQNENTLTGPPLELEEKQIQPGDSDSDKERKLIQQDLLRKEVDDSGLYETKLRELRDIVYYIAKETGLNAIVNPINKMFNDRFQLGSYNSRFLERSMNELINLLEYAKNTIYMNENPDAGAGGIAGGQINFYMMPPEPSTEEFERWERAQEGLLATTEPYKGEDSWGSEGFAPDTSRRRGI